MKLRHGRWMLQSVLGILAAMVAGGNGWAQDRLIETAPGVRRWASEAEMSLLSEEQHERGHCGGYFDVTDFPEHYAVEPLLDLAVREPKQQAVVQALLPYLSSERIFETVKLLSDFHTRHYKSPMGKTAFEWMAKQMQTNGKGRSDVRVEFFTHRFNQPSVIATIQGTGPHKDEIVVIGGHGDSINHSTFPARSENRAPGADDNASGTAVVMEVFRVLSQSGFRPDRTLQFMVYAAEEVGLLGSQDIAQRYRDAQKKVVAAIQFDMTSFPGTGNQITFITDNTEPGLTQFAQKLMDTYVKIPWSTDRCGYACSDHASWWKAGFPSVFPFESKSKDDNKYIHSVKDVKEIGNFGFAQHFAKLGAALVVELQTD